MVNRRALIIANPGKVGDDNYCHGVFRDIENYKSFLESPLGGLWSESEIKVLNQPDSSDVESEIKKQRLSDYSMTIFCGHGDHSPKTNSTIVEIKPGVDVDSNKLRVGAEKHTLILDCCRVVRTYLTEDKALERFMKALASVVNPGDCRKFYDNQISKCPSGIVVMFACSVGESAGDSAVQGGYYSYNLIKAARDWGERTFVDTSKDFRCLSVVKAHEMAIPGVSSMNPNRQNPTLEKPRSENYFPFAIIA